MVTIIMRNKVNVLILGGSGFIGTNLVKKFERKKNVQVIATYFKNRPKINSKRVKWIKVNLKNFSKVLKITKKIDILIQAAATTTGSKDVINKPYIHVTDNVVMNSYLFKAAQINSIKHFIFLSCTTMYKSSKNIQSENTLIHHKNFVPQYFASATTKTFNEQMCNFYSSLGITKYTVIRHSNIYGPYDKFDLEKSHFMGATITKVLTAKKNIEVWGEGKESRDFVFIDDLVKFIEKSILFQKSFFEIYNCSSDKVYKINDVVKKIIRLSKKKLNIIYNKSKPNIPVNIIITSKKARKHFNWKPETSIDQGIIKTINWWKKNMNNRNN